MTNLSPLIPEARADIRLALVGQSAVLFDPLSARVHRLNATAEIVWQCCDGSASVTDVCADLADVFAQPIDEVTDAVEAIIAELSAAGLFEGTTPPPPRFVADPEPDADHDEAMPTGTPLRRLGPYAALDLAFSVDCHDSPEVASEIERALSPLESDRRVPAAGDAVVMVVWGDGAGGWNLDAGRARLSAQDESVVCDYVLWQITRLAIEHSSRYLVLHASAVARDGVAVVFPAEANAGKSTLATVLVEAGFDYLSDEAVAIDLDTGEVVAYPKPITLDPGSQQLLSHLDPGGLAGRSPKWRISPESIRTGSVVERASLGHIVVPRFDVSADNVLAPMALIDAVDAVLSSAFNLGEHAQRLDRIVALCEGCTAHTLRHNGIDGPMVAVDSLFPPVSDVDYRAAGLGRGAARR